MDGAWANGGVSSDGASDAGLSATEAAGTAMSRWRRYRWRGCSAGSRPPRVVVSGLAAGLPACRPARRARVRLAAQRGGLPPAPGEKEPGRIRDGDAHPASGGGEAGRRLPGTGYRVAARAVARSGPMPTAGRLRSRAVVKPSPRPGLPPAGELTAVRTTGCTCRRRAGASTYQLVYLAIGDASSMISTCSRESFSKARHMATSSQESRGPCSSPVASSTTM